ncbi:uncharacterized protein N7503_010105 [Penicillium pulvis]|uniref:uncharacterized protein n=1 Tax=Penicillium pulvis TaxID=1562058 RepID=UPI002549AC9D|nr:uncharacterized protein N7503_010105 [Penicillium pulvis]KAJ5784893.1 hypothetical protein N7503_010105 [Penicillium pulvis]
MLLGLSAAALGYVFLVAIYRLYLHPISKLPGPKLAAVTSLYGFYFNVVKGGRYLWEIEKMHKKYGPIVRIDPNEVHIADPYFYSEIYAPKLRDKDPRFVRLGDIQGSMLFTVGHNLHASRRAVLQNFFSKMSILGLESMIQKKVDKLAQRMKMAYQAGTVFNLDAAFAAIASDVIGEYAYGFSLDYLDHEDFGNEIRDSMLSILSLSHLMMFFPIPLSVVKAVPKQLLQKFSPALANILYVRELVLEQAKFALKESGKGGSGKKTIFEALADPSLPPEERAPTRIRDEALSLLNAGTETTAGILRAIFFHLLHDKTKLLNLRNELEQSPSASFAELERLPYMRGVINEGLRLAGAIGRLPRCVPTGTGLIYEQWVIPPKVMISQCNLFIHMNADLFPDPHSFDPERWIRSQENGDRLENMLVAFSKGPRQCLGINLATAELYLIVATLVRRFDMDLYKTTFEDIETYRDYQVGFPKEKSPGLRAIITQDLCS